ncbi:MAG: selenide, water dikinase SelD [Solirubrobacterales bacterium]
MDLAQPTPRLTSLSHGAGCACKIGAAQLSEIRAGLPSPTDSQLMVGLDPADDAAVYLVGDGLALVQTIDFFPPIVDDPFEFGRIAAANALSDIYAMGARPIFALNVLAFSLETLGMETLMLILKGGASVAAQAGIAVAGGHSIDDPEPKYGMTVTGIADPQMVLTKAGAQPGDSIFLTKPIGGGLITTAAKRGLADTKLISKAIDVMTTLNESAAEQAQQAGVHAMTDVTGFGLAGHLHEMCLASGLAAELDADAVPSMSGTLTLAKNRACQSGGSRRNADHAATFTNWGIDVPPHIRILLTDAMTSGGLLMAVPENQQSRAPGHRIGHFVTGSAGEIRVHAG